MFFSIGGKEIWCFGGRVADFTQLFGRAGVGNLSLTSSGHVGMLLFKMGVWTVSDSAGDLVMILQE